VDGNYTADAKGKQTYAPRADDEMSKYEDLVKSAIGFDDKRGDTIKVENMQFAQDAESVPEAQLPLGLTKEDITKLLETVVLGLVAVMFIVLVVRPLTTRVMAAVPATPPGSGGGAFAMPGAGGNMLSDQSGGQPLLGQSGMSPEQLAERVMAVDSEIDRMINMEQVEGRVRASSLKKISEIVDKHPEQAVAILRNWLYQDPNR
jgi:flagellar M-ring protein FliF